MQNIIIFKNREIYRRNSDILGIWGENNYETLCFGFYDDFIDGDAILEFEFPNGQKKFVELEKDIEEKFYKILIKSSLLQQEGDIKLELKIINEDEIIYKTKIFIMKVLEAINATATFEDDYPDFVETTTAKLQELENKKQDKLIAGDNITIVDNVISSTGGAAECKVDDVLVNGESVVENKIANIEVPTAVSELKNDSGYLTEESDPTVPQHVKDITEENINDWNNKSDFSGDYTDIGNKPSINGVELVGNKTASDLEIYEEVIIGSEEPTSEGWKLFVDETEPEPNYATVEYVDEKVSEITVPTKTSELENDSNFIDETSVDDKLKDYAKTTDIPDVSKFITKDVTELTNFYDKNYIDTTIGNIETLLSNIADEGEVI